MDSIFIECFSGLKEPRVERTRKHILLDVLALSICGVLSGAEGWEEIEDFGKEHENWFRQFLKLPHGIPSHDTIRRVFQSLNPQTFQTTFLEWVQTVKNFLPETVVPIDGKALRGSHERSKAMALT